jgi:phage protein D/phage baseplate assembly protein gpV
MAVPVPACKILLEGAALDDALMYSLLDVQVRDSLLLPDTAVVRFQDPEGALIDDRRFAVGATLEVKFARTAGDQLTTTFKGEIVAIEPEFGENDLVISFRAYDKGWRLNRARKSRTFKNVTATDMVQIVGAGVGLSAGTLSGGRTIYEFFQQSMETDWEFCWRLARMHNCEFFVDGDVFHFRPRKATGAVARLEWGGSDGELLAFKPRLSGMGQVDSVTVKNHDPKTRRELSGMSKAAALPHKSAAVDARTTTVNKLGGGSVIIADRVAESVEEAESIAQSTLDRLASSFVEAEGRAFGNPAVRAGTTVTLGKVGRFSGDYVLSQTTHRFGGGAIQYVTSFVISGRTSHTFRDLLRPNEGTDWGSSVVIGIVTNNIDKDDKGRSTQLGRVKVKFPALGDGIESGWARVLTPNAGKDHGMFYMPQVDDEVVVAFEHGDTRRPLIIGSLFNGLHKPLPEIIDPSETDKKPLFGVKTPHEAYVESKQKMTLRSHEKMTVEVKKDGQGGTGDFTLDAAGKVEQKAATSFKETSGTTFEIEAGSSVTIKGKGSVTVEATAGLTLKGATVDIQATGPVNVKGSMINLG